MNARSYQKLLFSVLSLVYLQPFIQSIIATITAGGIMADLRLNPQEMGILGASFLFPYACSMLASGMLSAYFGPRKNLAGMFLVAGTGGLLFSHSESLAVACVGRAMTGIGTAVCMTSSFTLFARWFRAESFAKVTGLFFALGGCGSFLGAGPLSMVNVAFGWRFCFTAMALITLFFAVLVFAVIRDWPSADTEKELGIVSAPRTAVTPRDMLEGLGILAKDRDFRRLVLWFCSMSSMYQSFVGLWAAPYFKDVFHLGDTQAGFAASMFAFGFIAGCPLLNWYCEKRLRSNRVAIGASGIAVAAFFLPLFLLPGKIGAAGIAFASLMLGMGMNAPNTLVYASARNVFGSRLGSIASGLMAGMSLVAGAMMQLCVSGLLSFATSRSWGAPDAYLLAFCMYLPACAIMTYCGFTLSRASDPGHISTRSWRMILKRQPVELSGRPDIGPTDKPQG